MKILEIAVFGIAASLIVACGESSTSAPAPESPLNEGLAESSSDMVENPYLPLSQPVEGVSSGETVYQQGLSSANNPLVAYSSSSGLPASSASIPVNFGTGDSEDDDIVALNGSETTLTFNGTDVSIANDNGCLEKAAGTITIKCSGNYYLTGMASDYQVVVNTAEADTGKVDLFLNGVSLKSGDAPLYVQNAEKTELHLVKGTTNTIEDGATRTKTYTLNGKIDTTKAAPHQFSTITQSRKI